MIDKVRQEIGNTNIRFFEAFRRRDAAAIASFYTEDAKLLPSTSGVLIGRQAIQESFDSSFKMGARDVIFRSLEIDCNGDLAYEVSTYTIEIQPEGAQAVKVPGRAVVVWKRQADGSWKLAVDSFHRDIPGQTQ